MLRVNLQMQQDALVEARNRADHSAASAITAKNNAELAQAAETKQRNAAVAAQHAAETAQHAAEASQKQAEHVSQFLRDLLMVTNPHRGMNVSGIVELLNEASRKLDAGELRDHPATEAQLRSTLGFGYENLGLNQQAQEQRRKVLELASAKSGEHSIDAANALMDLARSAQPLEHDRLVEQYAKLEAELYGADSPEEAGALIELSIVYEKNNDDRAQTVLRQAVDTYRRHPDAVNQKFGIALALARLAEMKQRKHDLSAAETLSREAVQTIEQFDSHNSILTYHWQLLASILDQKGSLPEAEQYQIKALERCRELYPRPIISREQGLPSEEFGGDAESSPEAEGAEARLRELCNALDKVQIAAAPDLHGVTKSIIEIFQNLGDGQAKTTGSLPAKLRLRQQVALQTAALKSLPNDPWRLATRGITYGELGLFKEAANDLDGAMGQLRTEQEIWHHGLFALLQDGRVDTYRRRRSEALRLFADASDPTVLTRVIKDCLIYPADNKELATAAELANRARGRFDRRHPTSRRGAAMQKESLEYRTWDITRPAIPRWLEASIGRGSDPRDRRVGTLHVDGLFSFVTKRRGASRSETRRRFCDASHRDKRWDVRL